MMRRPSFTASIGPSPVRGFMAAIELPLSWLTLHYLPGGAGKSRCVCGQRLRRSFELAPRGTAALDSTIRVESSRGRRCPSR